MISITPMNFAFIIIACLFAVRFIYKVHKEVVALKEKFEKHKSDEYKIPEDFLIRLYVRHRVIKASIFVFKFVFISLFLQGLSALLLASISTTFKVNKESLVPLANYALNIPVFILFFYYFYSDKYPNKRVFNEHQRKKLIKYLGVFYMLLSGCLPFFSEYNLLSLVLTFFVGLGLYKLRKPAYYGFIIIFILTFICLLNPFDEYLFFKVIQFIFFYLFPAVFIHKYRYLLK